MGIKIAGPDLKVVQQIGQQPSKFVGKVEGAASVYAERVAGGRYVKVDIDRLKAARYGLNIADVQAVLATAVGGMDVGQTIEGANVTPSTCAIPELSRFGGQPELLPLVTPGLVSGSPWRTWPGPTSATRRPCCAAKTHAQRLGPRGHPWPRHRPLWQRPRPRWTSSWCCHRVTPLTWSGQYEYMERAMERLTTWCPDPRHYRAAALSRVSPLPGGAAHPHHPCRWRWSGIWAVWLPGLQPRWASASASPPLAGVAVETGVLMLVYPQPRLGRSAASGKPDKAGLHQAVIHGAALRLQAPR